MRLFFLVFKLKWYWIAVGHDAGPEGEAHAFQLNELKNWEDMQIWPVFSPLQQNKLLAAGCGIKIPLSTMCWV